MKEKLSGVLAIVSASVASICCIGPIVLLALGLGGLGIAARLVNYRPVFTLLALGFLAVAFYKTYRRKEPSCTVGCSLEDKASSLLNAEGAQPTSQSAWPGESNH